MRIYHNQLAKSLSQPMPTVWLIFGDEPWQKNDALRQIQSTAVQQGYSERISLTADKGFDWHGVLDEYLSMSLFASQRVIEVELLVKVDEAAGKVLLSLIEQLHQDVVLILHGAKVDAATTNKKWFKALNDNGIYLPIYDLDPKGLKQWLSRQASQYQVNLPAESQSLLIELFEGNILALDQELQKLSILFANQQVSADEITHLAIKQAKFNPFQLIDTLLLGNTKKCLSILDQLSQEGSPVGQIIWFVHKELKTLKVMLLEQQSGSSFAQLCKKHRIWKNKEPLYKSALSKLNTTSINSAISKLASIDLISKTTSDFDPYLLLSDLIVGLFHPNTYIELPLDYEYD